MCLTPSERYCTGLPAHMGSWVEPTPSVTQHAQRSYPHTISSSSSGLSRTVATVEHDSSAPVFAPAVEPLYLASCEWGTCPILLDDTSPAGIMRHLREWHLCDDTKPFNKTRRGQCQWAGGCGKEMAYASFGKHVSYVHLRHDIRCPNCNRDIGRAGLLPLHLQRYCKRVPRHEQTE